MKLGKLVTVLLLDALGWQHQAMLGEKASLVRSLPRLTNTWMEMRIYRIRMARRIRERGAEHPSSFGRWLDGNFDADGDKRPSVDHSGGRHRLEQRHMRALKIRSCGPDRTCNTPDDLTIEG